MYWIKSNKADIFYICLTKFAWAFFWDLFLDFGFKNGQRRSIFLSPLVADPIF